MSHSNHPLPADFQIRDSCSLTPLRHCGKKEKQEKQRGGEREKERECDGTLNSVERRIQCRCEIPHLYSAVRMASEYETSGP